MIPTVDHIARAAVAAAKEVGCDPFLIDPRRRPFDLDGRNNASRLRAYAALGLNVAFPEVSKMGIAALVHAGSREVYIAGLLRRIRFGECLWFSQAALDRIVAFIQDGAPDQSPDPEPPAGGADKPTEAIDPPPPIPPRPEPEAAPAASLARRLGLISQSAPPSRARAYDLLHDAVRNTK